MAESKSAATLLIRAGLRPGVIYTSELGRAKATAEIVRARAQFQSPVALSDWRLNERNYGALTGLSKGRVLADYGAAKFYEWRRSVNSAPPPMSDDLYEALRGYPPFDELPPQALTRTESLREVIERVRTFVERSLIADLRRRSTVLVVGHGNSLRALCGVLDSLGDAELEELVIPTGAPLIYEFDRHLVPSRRGGTYLDERAARKATLRLRNEGGT